MLTTVESGLILDYSVDLSSINIIDDNGQIWVPDENMVDVFVTSSDPDVLAVDEGGAIGNLLVGAPGIATLEFTIWHEGRVVAANSRTYLVSEGGEGKQVQVVGVTIRERNEA